MEFLILENLNLLACFVDSANRISEACDWSETSIIVSITISIQDYVLSINRRQVNANFIEVYCDELPFNWYHRLIKKCYLNCWPVTFITGLLGCYHVIWPNNCFKTSIQRCELLVIFGGNACNLKCVYVNTVTDLWSFVVFFSYYWEFFVLFSRK